jgi:hypothetical protein
MEKEPSGETEIETAEENMSKTAADKTTVKEKELTLEEKSK